MGTVNLARVDERLIHGQVMVTLSKRAGVNSIFVIDDGVAEDPFMKGVYKSAGGRTGNKTIVMTTEKAKYYWDEFEFKDYNAILIAKTVGVYYELIKHGVPIKELNIGGIAQKDAANDVQASKAVYMNQKDAEQLKELRDDYGVEVYFQATPSDTKVGLDEVLKKFNL